MLVRCPKCGGNVEVAQMRTGGREVELAGVFNLEISPLEARVCTQCGYTEIYATQPEEIGGPAATPEPTVAGFYDE